MLYCSDIALFSNSFPALSSLRLEMATSPIRLTTLVLTSGLMSFNIIIIIIIIMAGMAVVLRGWLPHRGEAQMAYNYCFPTRTMF